MEDHVYIVRIVQTQLLVELDQSFSHTGRMGGVWELTCHL